MQLPDGEEILTAENTGVCGIHPGTVPGSAKIGLCRLLYVIHLNHVVWVVAHLCFP
jgi:hypothetical protein